MTSTIVIPAYNEEKTLPALLRDIAAQRGADPQVVVADAESTDRTREIARSRGATVVEGGLPAAGRNSGARDADTDILIFLDADVRIPKRFVRTVCDAMEGRDLVAATCPMKPLSRLSTDRVIHNFANLFVRLTQYSDPNAPGYCIAIRRDVFERIGGFDESLKVAEDHDLVKRAAKHGAFRVVPDTHVRVDVRRFEKEGRVGYSLKAIKVSLHRALVGEIREDDDVVDYEFGDYSEDSPKGAMRALRRLEKAMLKLDSKTTDVDEAIVDQGTRAVDAAVENTIAALRNAWDILMNQSDLSRRDSDRSESDRPAR
ncbi:MAG: glycosyltransferase [Spirochaetaceae bacterium]|nr:MAG: glycosyltransferase [Spirochaetaceae bacterium]